MDYKLERSNFWFPTVMSFVDIAMNLYSDINIEMPKATEELIQRKPKKDISIFYYSLHISMLETLAIPYAIYRRKGEVPYIIAADTLFEGSNADIMKNVGVILLDTKQKVRETERMTKLISEISEQYSILVFPEGTRSRTGLPKRFPNAPFEPAVHAAKYRDTYLINVNPSYSNVNEIPAYIEELGDEFKRKNNPLFKKEKKKYGFSRNDIIGWLNHQGKTYISFSEPIKVNTNQNRKELSTLCYMECLNNVKIQPINVYGLTMQRLNQRKLPHTPENIESVMNEALQELKPHADKFRGFNKDDDAKDVLHVVVHNNDSREDEIYANYIHHLLAK
jgi:1-acyl-sn-glycerol-3-phosphate acyltransferase